MIVLIVIAAILGGILLLLLTLLAILLLVPFKINIFASNTSKFTLKLNVSWLFRLVKVYYEKRGDKSRTKVEIFFITLGNKKKKIKKSKARKGLEDKPSTVEKEAKEEPKPKPLVEEKPSPKSKPEPKPKPHVNEEHEPESEDDGIMAKLEKAKSQLDYIYNYPQKDILIRLTIKLCMELLKALKPKRFCVNGEIGTGDPALTGQLLGVIYNVRSFTGLNIDIKGDFENASLNGDVTVESNIYLYRFVVPLCKYVLARPVWKIIKKFVFRKDGKK